MSAPAERLSVLADREPGTRPPAGLPRLLAGGEGPRGLEEHRSLYPAPSVGSGADLIEEVERAGLRGRGGAGFPMARKMRAVASGRGRPVVMVNGVESEPASRKDRLLLTTRAHLVLDGAFLAASAVGADRVELCVDTDDADLSLRRALHERATREPSAVRARIVRAPRRYVTGEERALVHLLNGGPAVPPVGTDRSFAHGVDRRPTLVQNVETLAHLAQVHAFGSTWFRTLGTEAEPGTRLVTVSGGVARPDVYEIAGGTPVANLLRAAGGRPEDVQAVLVGGYFGSWLSLDRALDLRLDDDDLTSAGAGFGAGVLCFLPRTACGLAETARVASWMSGQTAGQCGPCVHGLAAIASAVAELVLDGDPEAEGRVRRWSGDVEGRGACRLPDGTVRFVRSAMDVFAEETRRHRTDGGCASIGAPAVLPTPEGDAQR
jgi:NADH:ubiquinone oxidoreductase subunit F (NADH-binding)